MSDSESFIKAAQVADESAPTSNDLSLMDKSALLKKVAALREKACKANRLALGLPTLDQRELIQFADELEEQATAFERAVAEKP